MAFHLSLALSDIPDLVDVALAAFENDPILSFAKQDCTWSDLRNRDLSTCHLAFSEQDKHQDSTKVTDAATGKLVSFCRWRSPAPEAGLAPSAVKRPNEAAVKGLNAELWSRFGGDLIAKRKIHYDSATDCFFHILVTHPSYQRRGLATRLVEYIMKLADRDGAETYVDASSAGYSFYLKREWNETARFEIDLGQYGGAGIRLVKSMIRPPKIAGTSG
ncbi:hypothetical protein K461DRAFT_298029 [Myriangium duriaei CBS 260.36]|uniref:N-acetyltransferase domain-containing protein n=1 Tax=Myriangium duriaei CBS 260.36 TaxID=1168546 RepID=A0A9P4MHI3_9PEZI|nr:hypothetical protein K461DRAFT_298029 [Myriangium duriaei CBS 260.36]